MKKVAITGSIGSGKTTVCNFLQQLGAYVLSADTIAHQFLTLQHPIGQQVVALLGDQIVEGGEIRRENIAKCVFHDQKQLKSLERLLHPKIRQEIERHYQQIAPNPDYTAFVVEVPLLFEAGWADDYDLVVAVDREHANLTDQQAVRQSRQLPPQEKRRLADITLTNNHSLEALFQAVKSQVQPHLTQEEQ